MLLSQQFNTVTLQNGARAAFRYLDKDISYNDVKGRIARLSYLFQKELGQNLRVAFLTSNSPAVFVSFMAFANTRSLTIPLDPSSTNDELAAWIKDAKATHLAVTSDLVPRAREMMDTHALYLPIVEIEKKQGGEYDSAFTTSPDKLPIDADPILLLRTAGTVDRPKLALFNHKQLLSAVVAVKAPYHVKPTDRFLTSMNWSHPFAFIHGLLLPLMTGATCVVDYGLDGADFLGFLVKSRVTRLVGHPKSYERLTRICREVKWEGLPGVKSATVGLGVSSRTSGRGSPTAASWWRSVTAKPRTAGRSPWKTPARRMLRKTASRPVFPAVRARRCRG